MIRVSIVATGIDLNSSMQYKKIDTPASLSIDNSVYQQNNVAQVNQVSMDSSFLVDKTLEDKHPDITNSQQTSFVEKENSVDLNYESNLSQESKNQGNENNITSFSNNNHDNELVDENEKDLKRIASERQRMKREIEQKKISTQSLDAISAMIKDGAVKTLPLVIKGDVDGSIEALAETLEKIKHEEVGVQVIHKAVGMVTESDVLLAAASNAVVIGFHVQISSNAKLLANQEGVEIRSYTVIYNAVEDVKLALEGLLEPEKVENVLGRASVLEMFKIPKIGFIAGSKVEEGVMKRGEMARVIRENEVIHEGAISSLKRFKDDVKEVKEGMECGIGVEEFNKFKENDEIVVYEIQQIKRKLETA